MAAIVRAGAEGIGRVHAAAPEYCASRAEVTKDWIISGLFTPGAVSTPDETSTPGALAEAMARRHILRVQPARQQPWPRNRPCTEQLPVERHAMSAGAVCVRGRLGIEQDHVGGLFISRQGSQNRLHRKSRSP